MEKCKIEVCLTPGIYENYRNDDAIVVVVDILRATSAICTAFMNGAKRIIPVASLEEAQDYKNKGYMVAAERDGIVRDFADFGNSPYNFTPERIKDQEIVYSTTNGTNTIMMASNSHEVLIGAYLNHKALVEHITDKEHDVLILCAGWKNKFNLEDTLFAGALAESILLSEKFFTICDSTYAAMDLWNVANQDMNVYLEKVAQRHRLKENGLDDVLEYCHTFNLTEQIPCLEDNYLVTL